VLVQPEVELQAEVRLRHQLHHPAQEVLVVQHHQGHLLVQQVIVELRQLPLAVQELLPEQDHYQDQVAKQEVLLFHQLDLEVQLHQNPGHLHHQLAEV
jgi:hypothetical protein